MMCRDTYKKLVQFGSLAIVVLLLATIFVSVAQASPPAQDPRPPAPGKGGGKGPSGVDAKDGRDRIPGPPTCGAVSGQIINWGYRPEPEVPAVLKTGSWQLSALSSDRGNYAFGGLGVGVAKLNVLLAPKDPLQPLIQDAAIYLTCDFPTVANVAIYSGPTVEPPVTLEMSAPGQIVTWDERTRITLTIENDLPTEISNVILTNLMPFGLQALDVSTSAEVPPENLRIVDGGDDGQLVVVFLDKLAAGAKETIILTVTAIEDTPLDTQITNTATLFYRESVAVQATLDFSIGSPQPIIPAAVKANAAGFAPASKAMDRAEAELEAAALGQTEATPLDRPQPSPTGAAVAAAAKGEEKDTSTAVSKEDTGRIETTKEEPASTDELLPVTGNKASEKNLASITDVSAISNSNLIGSLSGVGLVVLALVAYTWRAIYWRTEEQN